MADLMGWALIVASAAIIDIDCRIDTDTVTIGLACGAEAFAANTKFAAGAFVAACSTMIGIAIEIDTRARA
jgi:hypothetical protein